MTKPKRCTKCSKLLRPRNKSGLCNYHTTLKLMKEKAKLKCYVCEESCSGKMIIEWRKGTRSSFCTRHFNKLNPIQDPTKLREEMYRLKSLH